MIKLQNISRRMGFLIAIAGAAVIGGATTAIVSAATPSSADGKISACYRNAASLTDVKGALRVLDNQATPAQTCSAQETALSWDQLKPAPVQQSSGPILHDANGQVLGRPTSEAFDKIYIASVNRYARLAFNPVINAVEVGDNVTFDYASTDCSGTPYVSDPGQPPIYDLYRYNGSSPAKYIIVQNNAVKQYVEVKSSSGGYQPGNCQPVPDDGTSYGRDAYPVTEVTLPFNLPIVQPYKL